MIGTLSHRLLQLVAAIAAVLTVVVALLAWRIASGPVALDWLTPYIAAALSTDDGRVRTSIGSTRLRLSDDVKLIELVAVDVRATGSDGELLALLPEIEVGLSLRALLQGVIAVAHLDAIAPHLVLLRKEDGSIGLRGRDDAGAGQIELGLLIEKVLNPPDPSDPASYLERFEIVGGRMTLIDEGSGQQIEAQDADLVLLRHADGLGGNLAFELVQAGAPARVRLSGRYQTASEWIRFGLDFDGLMPADLASLAPAIPLAGVGLPLSGRLEGAIKLDGERAPVGFELAAGQGLLDLPDLLIAPLAVDGAHAAGELASDLESIAVQQLRGHLHGGDAYRHRRSVLAPAADRGHHRARREQCRDRGSRPVLAAGRRRCGTRVGDPPPRRRHRAAGAGHDHDPAGRSGAEIRCPTAWSRGVSPSRT